MLKIDRIAQIAIRVHNVDRAVAFYRDILELRFLFRAGNLAFFDCGGVRILLDKPDDAEFDHPSSVIYFNVADIDAAVKRVKAGGGQLLEGPIEVPDGSWIVRCMDPQGAIFALVGKRRYKAMVFFEPLASRDSSR